MSMILLPADQIDTMVVIMDYILAHPLTPVEDIRKRFGITSDEYNMIFDLTMPEIRMKNLGGYWKTKYVELKSSIKRRIQADKRKTKLGDDILQIIASTGASHLNQTAKIDVSDLETDVA